MIRLQAEIRNFGDENLGEEPVLDPGRVDERMRLVRPLDI
jgi:hypothetical protein